MLVDEHCTGVALVKKSDGVVHAKGYGEATKVVTCSHLLSHSSGIEDYAVVRDCYNVVDGFCPGDTVDGMIRELMGKRLHFDPGSMLEYSKIGYTRPYLDGNSETSSSASGGVPSA